MLSHRTLRTRALARPEVRAEFERLKPEFAFLDQILAARKAAGVTQARSLAESGRLNLQLRGSNRYRRGISPRSPRCTSTRRPSGAAWRSSSSRAGNYSSALPPGRQPLAADRGAPCGR